MNKICLFNNSFESHKWCPLYSACGVKHKSVSHKLE